MTSRGIITIGALTILIWFGTLTGCQSSHQRGVDPRDADLDSAGDADEPSESATDGDLDIDADGDGVVGPGCPADMVLITSITNATTCIDRYEASRGESDVAMSASGRSPWVGTTWIEAVSACNGAVVEVEPGRPTLEKSLCTSEQWQAACQGTAGSAYPYGPTYDSAACNGSDRTGRVFETGSMPGCEGGEPGLFDMSGNAREWVHDCTSSGCAHVGGSFVDQQHYLQCAVEQPRRLASGEGLDDLGFRCCLVIPTE